MEGCHYRANPQAREVPGGDRVKSTDRPLFRPREAHGEEWSREKKLELNISKCLVSFFSADNHHARWQPQVVVEGEVLGFDPTPTFLGVTYDPDVRGSCTESSLKAG